MEGEGGTSVLVGLLLRPKALFKFTQVGRVLRWQAICVEGPFDRVSVRLAAQGYDCFFDDKGLIIRDSA